MKKIISILLILLALSLTLGAVSAEEVASDDVVAAEDTAAVSADESESAATPTTGSSDVAATPSTGSSDVTANATTDTAEADLAVDVEVLTEQDDGEIIWGVLVTNYGPDTAVNAYALVNGPDSLLLSDFIETKGTFDPITCIWEIGDLAKDEQALLILGTYIIGEGPYYVEALVFSDTFDPDLSNNYDIAFYGGEEVSAEQQEVSKMHATGNPIVMALLALLAIGAGGFRRKI
ncbi:DUF11 domain-containing protein [Methanobrevibacter sp.]|uniref:DUF11 domain-containing protein n=1 Tax=Methanobrevibacter sp. TaxID=66852 RepID=UPI00388DC0E3